MMKNFRGPLGKMKQFSSRSIKLMIYKGVKCSFYLDDLFSAIQQHWGLQENALRRVVELLVSFILLSRSA